MHKRPDLLKILSCLMQKHVMPHDTEKLDKHCSTDLIAVPNLVGKSCMSLLIRVSLAVPATLQMTRGAGG